MLMSSGQQPHQHQRVRIHVRAWIIPRTRHRVCDRCHARREQLVELARPAARAVRRGHSAWRFHSFAREFTAAVPPTVHEFQEKDAYVEDACVPLLVVLWSKPFS